MLVHIVHLFPEIYQYATAKKDRISLANTTGHLHTRGRVEIKKWGDLTYKGLCDVGFGLNEADKVCKEIGANGAIRVFRGSHFGVGINSSEFAYGSVSCKSERNDNSQHFWQSQYNRYGYDYESLQECQWNETSECGADNWAGVECISELTFSPCLCTRGL